MKNRASKGKLNNSRDIEGKNCRFGKVLLERKGRKLAKMIGLNNWVRDSIMDSNMKKRKGMFYYVCS